MSTFFDTEGGMAHEEKRAWIELLVSIPVYVVYLVVVLSLPRPMGLAAVEYAKPLLVSIGASIGATILIGILVGIFAGSAGKTDQRDREIGRFGESIGQSFVVIGGVAALILALLEVDHFWIANAVYLAFVLSAVLGSIAKINFYRRGFQHA